MAGCGTAGVLGELLTFVDIMKPLKFAFWFLLFVLQLVKAIILSVCVLFRGGGGGQNKLRGVSILLLLDPLSVLCMQI